MRNFFKECMLRAEVSKRDAYHRALFYALGISSDVRRHIDSLYDFDARCIKLEGFNQPWQTSSTLRCCRLAFNLFNGFCSTGEDWDNLENDAVSYTPYELFGGSNTVYMCEAVKIRFEVI